jgi:hypothetical protein
MQVPAVPLNFVVSEEFSIVRNKLSSPHDNLIGQNPLGQLLEAHARLAIILLASLATLVRATSFRRIELGEPGH